MDPAYVQHMGMQDHLRLLMQTAALYTGFCSAKEASVSNAISLFFLSVCNFLLHFWTNFKQARNDLLTPVYCA